MILGKEDEWQSDNSQPNIFIKIQTALAILVDRNPEGVFSPGSSKYKATTPLFKQIYQRNWEIAKSKQQLKLFIFNLAKYGWAIARTFPKRVVNKVKVIKEYNEEEPEKSVWEEKEIVEYNDIFRENLDPWNAWIDDMAKPNNPWSLKDWCWRKVYDWDTAKVEFENYKNWKYVKQGGNLQEKITGGIQKKYEGKKMVEIVFYESIQKDLFMVIANGVPVIIEPLPISDADGHKRLSLWQTYWVLRHAESAFGVGIYEATRYDQTLLDRFRNMTIDQLTLSIYKMFFYQGTEKLTETGVIKVTPGVGKQVLNPKDMQWLQIPGPGAEAWKGIEMFKNDVNEASGITEPLMGTIVGKTAFEIAQAKEAALKRLKTPLENICEALEEDGYTTISLIQLLYSIPETIKIADPEKIEAYLKEIQSDSQLYEEAEATEEGGRQIVAKIYREIQLGLEEDEKGNLIETEKTRFFRVKPKFLKWNGIIKIKPQSILTPSKQLDKALDLEMLNMVIPLLGQPPEIFQKVVKNILKLYEKTPEDWLPDSWLEEKQQQAERPLFVPQGEQPMMGERPMPQGAETLVPRTEIPEQPAGIGGKLVGALTNAFRKMR